MILTALVFTKFSIPLIFQGEYCQMDEKKLIGDGSNITEILLTVLVAYLFTVKGLIFRFCDSLLINAL